MAAMKSAILLCALTMAVGSVARAGMHDVRKCVEANMPRISTVQKILLRVEENGVASFESRLTLYWRKLDDGERRIVLRFREPEDLSGSALLVHAKPRQRPRVYVYLAGQGKARSVSSRGELEGFLGRANLGIDELELILDPLGEAGNDTPARATSLGTRGVWELDETLTNDDDARFTRRVTHIDKEFCIALRSEFFDSEGAKSKTLEIDPARVERVAESWIPKRLVFHDLIRNSDTVLLVEDAEVDTALSPALLTVGSLPRLSR
jgi:hypothetical protein